MPQYQFKRLRDIWLSDKQFMKVSTGIETLDSITNGGLLTQNLYVFQAPTGVGKTTFLMDMCLKCLKSLQKVMYITAGEQDIDEIASRLACMHCHVSYKDYMNMGVDDKTNKIIYKLQKDYGTKLYIFYTDDPMTFYRTEGEQEPATDLQRALKICQEEKIQYIFYDYLGSTPCEDDKEFKFLTNLAGELKNLATANNLCICTCMQTNRMIWGEIRKIKNKDDVATDYKGVMIPLFNEDFSAKSVGVATKATVFATIWKLADRYYMDVFKNRITGEVCRIPLEIKWDDFSYTFSELTPF